MTVQIRDATAGDEPEFRRLWQGFTDGYGLTLAPGVTDFTWARLMDPASALKARLAVAEGAVLGFAIHQHHPSSWVLGDDGYLEDLFVSAAARGRGAGRALIEDLYAIARARGWHRVYWMTEITNTAARKLYDSLAPCDDHIRYRREL